jgi:D-arabinose 1-dehydrogenase-like Zn-dependent alcohol dehydrogenase
VVEEVTDPKIAGPLDVIVKIGGAGVCRTDLHIIEGQWDAWVHNDLAELMALAQSGKVTLHTKTYPLDAAPEALADLDTGRVRGRAILVP